MVAETPADLRAVEEIARARIEIKAEVEKRIIGQQRGRSISCSSSLFARGHCLFVGVPGLAKTLLISTLAEVLNLSFNRIQFTPDLMPSDITGTDVLEEDHATGRRVFRFIHGPVFANIVLADEINRTPPKTQAALLQSMQEYRVTAGGATHPLPAPFLVFATQNPIEQEGTYPLAGGAARSLHVPGRRRLSDGGRGSGDRQAADERSSAVAAEGPVARAHPGAAGAGAARAGRRSRRALRGGAGARDAAGGVDAAVHPRQRLVRRRAARVAVS